MVHVSVVMSMMVAGGSLMTDFEACRCVTGRLGVICRVASIKEMRLCVVASRGVVNRHGTVC